MKALPVNKALGRPVSDFYTSTLAPVNHSDDLKFRASDALLLIVLFLEVAVVMRLFLAN